MNALTILQLREELDQINKPNASLGIEVDSRLPGLVKFVASWHCEGKHHSKTMQINLNEALTETGHMQLRRFVSSL